MGIAYNPSIVTNGLVLAYDAANVKSYDPRENLLTYSEDSTSYNYIDNATVAASTLLSPGNISTAHKLTSTLTGGSNNCFVQKIATVAADTSTYVFSLFLKKGTSVTSLLNLQLAGGTYQQSIVSITWATATISASGGTGTITDYGNGWYRVSITLTNNGTNTAIYPRIYVTDQGTNNVAGHYVYIWGWQCEKGTTATNYIKTIASNNPRTTSVSDLSGNSNTATISSLSYADITTFNFNGTSNYISDSTLTFTSTDNNTTILCWAWPDSTGPVNSYTGLVAFGGRANVTPSNAVLLCLNTNAATWYVGSAYWNNDYNPSNLPVTKDAWNMVGIVARSAGTTNNTKLICGNSSGLTSVTGSSSDYVRGVVPTKVNLTVGCTDNGGGRYMKGKIGLVLIYNRELSDTEIRQNFQAIKSRYGI